MTLWLMVVALLIGAGLSVQVGLNSQVRQYLGDPALAALGNFLVGTVAILVYLVLMRANWPSTGTLRAVPPVNWLGGLFGAAYVAASALLAPRLGSAPLLALLIGGQLLMSLVLDHYGWIGFATHEINAWRVAGAVLLVAGVVLIVRN
ncbi:MAG: DMT family transporter [Chromatiales bacterium]|nr:DMT family transporter [Chromatiales bacterium]